MILYFLLIICLSIIYPYYRKEAVKLTIKSNSILQFFYVYESTFNGLLFSIFICCYLFNKNLPLNIFQSEFFVSITRMSFIIFNLFNVIPNLFFSLNLVQLFLIYKNIITISIVLFGISIIISMIIAIMVFIPIRIVMKAIWKEKPKSKIELNFNN